MALLIDAIAVFGATGGHGESDSGKKGEFDFARLAHGFDVGRSKDSEFETCEKQLHGRGMAGKRSRIDMKSMQTALSDFAGKSS